MSTRQRERRSFPARWEVREAGGKVSITGYAAVFDQVAYGEVIRKGAFDKTLSENPDVRMLVNHAGVPIARTKSGTLTLSADAKGLKADAPDLDPENPTVAELASAMRRGDIDQMSFAFWPILDSNVDGVRELLELKIDDGDVSIVTYPWYDETSVELNAMARAVRDLEAGRALSSETRALVRRVGVLTDGLLTPDQVREREGIPQSAKTFARALAESQSRSLNGWTFYDLYPLLDEALDDMLETEENPYAWGYVIDVSDEWFTYWAAGSCWQCRFTVTAEGAVTLGTPIAVIGKMTYLAVPPDADSATEGDEPEEDAPMEGMSLRELLEITDHRGAAAALR